MSHDGSWRRSTWTPPKRFKSSVISKQARRWESTGAPFKSRTRAARLPDWHSPCLSRRQLSRLIVFLPLNPEESTILGDCETYSALLLKCSYFAHRCAFVPISPRAVSGAPLKSRGRCLAVFGGALRIQRLEAAFVRGGRGGALWDFNRL